ncbi:MAG: formate dehydrogenase accessory sulfurtransferase FdhD [Halieaceae bacterium]|nr:formate dehydrogenase accessory sulfurtransferase FdhD [Halieaceae bacterium]
MADSIISAEILSVSRAELTPRQDQLAVEEPLEIRLHYFLDGQLERRNIAITMRTPGHDRELALGFLAAEGIIQSAAQVQACEHSGAEALKGNNSNVIKVTLKPGVEVDIGRLERNFYTSSSCGVCGKASLEALETIGALAAADGGFTISAGTLHRLTGELAGSQTWFRQTGGLHAAALFDENGASLCLREDVGRHNAMDKVCGYRLLQSQRRKLGVFVSGRASFELMQKALMSGLPLLAAVGAPSSLAVQFAIEYNLTLVGFMRDHHFNIYAGEKRIALQ